MTRTITPKRIPELRHPGNPYASRVYTNAELDFDALHATQEGGPGLAVLDGWSVSYDVACERDPNATAVLNLRLWGGCCTDTPAHPLHGVRYPTRRDAERAAYQAGALGFLVFENQAAQWGLPTAAVAAKTTTASAAELGPAARLVSAAGRQWSIDHRARQYAYPAALMHDARHLPTYGRIYAHSLLRLAGHLATDPTTAATVARVAFPHAHFTPAAALVRSEALKLDLIARIRPHCGCCPTTPFIWGDVQAEQYASHGSTFKVAGWSRFGHWPIVYQFAGREWTLNDDAQGMAFSVSNRYPYRHDPVHGRTYAYYVLLLARHLGTDPTTAGALAQWVCPDGCTVLRSGARVVRVLRG